MLKSALLRKVTHVEFCWSVQGKGTSGDPTRPNTKVVLSGGSTRSSEESSVIELERRGRIIQFELTHNFKKKQDELRKTKSAIYPNNASDGGGSLQASEKKRRGRRSRWKELAGF